MHPFDLELTAKDIQALHDPDSVASFLANLGYDTGRASSKRRQTWAFQRLGSDESSVSNYWLITTGSFRFTCLS
jgi:hypothetical protein